MPDQRSPLRLWRVLLITLLLLTAIVALVPDEPRAVASPGPGKALAVAEPMSR